MELYNFFSEVTDDKESLNEIMIDLKEICHFVQLIEWPSNEFSNVSKRFSIIGQMYGEDTNVGDTNVICAFGHIKYTWFDAFCPCINNIKL